jgi:hypothetical protein
MGIEDKPLTLNKYVYADSNPVNNIDPSGNMSIGSLMTGVSGTFRLALSATPRVLNLGVNSAGKAVALSCMAQMVTSMVMAEIPNVVMSSQRSGCEMNQMRVQLQQGHLHTISHVAHATPNPGVTTDHVRAKLKHLYYSRSGEGWFPSALGKWMYDSIVELSMDLSRFPPYGVTMGGNILRKETHHRGKEYRIDIENLRGHNLRR